MNKIITFVAILSITFLNAQYHKGTVYFNDSISSEGFIKIKTFEGIKFKSSENAKPIDYNYEKILGYDFKGWQYRYVKKNETDNPKLLRLILEGKISIYDGNAKNPNSLNSGSSTNGMSVSLRVNPYKIYFIKANNKVFKVVNKFKKKQLEIFKECPFLIEKIENKEFEKWDVYDIVEFYNEDCE